MGLFTLRSTQTKLASGNVHEMVLSRSDCWRPQLHIETSSPAGLFLAKPFMRASANHFASA